jgi:hypothetical protein
MRDELAHESVAVLEGDDALILVAGSRLRELDLLSDQSFDPETDRAWEYRERGDSYLASALSSPPRVRPGKKRKNAPRAPLLITKVKMIGGRVVEVYGTLYEPETEDAGIEIEISLGITRDTGDMVDTGSAEAHRTDSCLASLGDLALFGARAGRPSFAPISAFVLAGVRRNVFRVGLAGPGTLVAVTLFRRGFGTLFLLSSGCHNISNLYPPIEATDMPFAEALM